MHEPLERGITLPMQNLVRQIDRDERSLVVTVSTRARDRIGDLLEPDGAQLDAYRKNPIVLWAHSYTLPPIARSLWVKVEDDRIIAKPQFARTAMAEEIFQLYAEGFLNAWSVGFVPLESEPLVSDAPDGRRLFTGYRIKRWELLEYSAVAVPANPAALTHALRTGRIRERILVKAFEKALEDGPAPETSGATPEKSGDAADMDAAQWRTLVREHVRAAVRQLTGRL